MKSSLLKQSELEEVYSFIANGDTSGALSFIKLWTIYCHEFDDLVDEEFNVIELVNTNNTLTKLLTSEFFIKYSQLLLPQIYLAAESYQASETNQKDTAIGEYLSHEGNNMLRTVALITGGYDHLVRCSVKIRELTYKEHPSATIITEEFNTDK